ncbi:MAG TPA: malto-oligosyltrehalose trehalohydrolase [Ramlibacter sp.]|uniref:malto-oligosyltrehalose trehalohydrolase n=1 Tax=Ramlibacter sp. TaxID=1917967 RepID=UPI002D1D338F|nr:malto-oligosyltrehalose trehalohydrolase [Ramlibacter sp.]HVZ46654.1 malto-oligosyltrehalose trehalohydrolase [Ramlibacter sp.]
MAHVRRRLPIGAECFGDEGVHFRVWAPEARSVEVVDEAGGRAAVAMEAQEGGYFHALVRDAQAGMRYRFRLDGGDSYPDPASRFQPEGPHGPSEVIDPASFSWSDAAWPGLAPQRQVVYELHVGTFTPEGSYAAAEQHLPYLKELGATVIELMPVNEFDGPFGWGYDGVDLFAPTHLYGRPDELRRFVDRAHAVGLGVILDVVYNHFGPSGNYLARFSSHYLTGGKRNEWGDAINFDGPSSAPVREFFTANAAYWIGEFHFDGLRLDATQALQDRSPRHIVADIAQAARAAARRKKIYLTAENEPQHAHIARPPAQGGWGIDALWNDDFHHSALVAATGYSEAYLSETRGTPQELISALKWGFLYQGQYYAWQSQRRGSGALDLPSRAFIDFLENHDQVANSARGSRLRERTTPGRLRALTALLLLGPGTPLLFQGQEWGATAPFLFFAKHGEELDALVQKGRGEFLAQFTDVASEAGAALVSVPSDASTFERCILDHSERERAGHAELLALHRDLLRLRREDRVFAAQDGTRLHGAVLGPEAFVLRYLGDAGDDRLLVVNLGATLPLVPAPEPLLAPPSAARWRILLSTEDPRYGGSGMAELDVESSWRLPPHALAVLAPAEWKDKDA